MHRIRFKTKAGRIRHGEFSNGKISAAGKNYPADDVTILPPTTASKVVGAGTNYYERFEDEEDIPDTPVLFIKTPNTIVGHRNEITYPASPVAIFEAELGVVISNQIKNIEKQEALDSIEGYVCINDVTRINESDVIRMKVFDNSTPIGPSVAPPESVPRDARIRAWVNGELKQDNNISDMIFSVSEIISEVSKMITLEPGDVVTTGTPAGAEPIGNGDRIEIEVEGVGRLENNFIIE